MSLSLVSFWLIQVTLMSLSSQNCGLIQTGIIVFHNHSPLRSFQSLCFIPAWILHLPCLLLSSPLLPSPTLLKNASPLVDPILLVHVLATAAAAAAAGLNKDAIRALMRRRVIKPLLLLLFLLLAPPATPEKASGMIFLLPLSV